LEADSEVKKLRDEFEYKERRRRINSMQAAVVALLTGLIGFTVSVTQFTNLFEKRSVDKAHGSGFVTDGLREKLDELEKQVTKDAELFKIATKPTQDTALSIRQEQISSEVRLLDERLSSLEKAIKDSPEKALAIPLMRKDIDESTRRLEEYRSANHSEIERLYDQQKWMLGGIGTVLLAVIGGAVSIIFRSLPKIGRDDA